MPEETGAGAGSEAPRGGWEPDASGRFGEFGGRYVAETLIAPLEDLETAFRQAREDVAFWATWRSLLRDFVGRPTPITVCERLTSELGGARIAIKREDLCHTGAHKINNTLGQCLLAKRMGKRRVIAETGAGQHGVATATACALLGLECRVYMGSEDVRRQALNVFRMQLMGAEVVPVETGARTLKDAINEAMRHWSAHFHDTFFCLGSVTGPHPYPWIVREFQSVIGEEARQQCLDQFGRLPHQLIACVGGGSNAIGLFHAFRDDGEVALVGVEAAGTGIAGGKHAAPLVAGSPGVLHGAYSYVLQTEDGQIEEAHSVSAGLDYPGVGPEHSFLLASGRAQYVAVTDSEAMAGFRRLATSEGIIVALETAHAIAHAIAAAPDLGPDTLLLVNGSGRGDKDMDTAARELALTLPGGAT